MIRPAPDRPTPHPSCPPGHDKPGEKLVTYLLRRVGVVSNPIISPSDALRVWREMVIWTVKRTRREESAEGGRQARENGCIGNARSSIGSSKTADARTSEKWGRHSRVGTSERYSSAPSIGIGQSLRNPQRIALPYAGRDDRNSHGCGESCSGVRVSIFFLVFPSRAWQFMTH